MCFEHLGEQSTDSWRVFRVGFLQEHEHECVLLVSHTFPCDRQEQGYKPHSFPAGFAHVPESHIFILRFWQMEKLCLKFWHLNLQFHAPSIQHPL